MKIFLSFILGFISISFLGQTPNQTSNHDPHWKLVWSDNFKGGYCTTGTGSPDPIDISSDAATKTYLAGRGWDIPNNFEAGTPQIYKSANVQLVNGVGIKMTAKAENVNCGSCSNGGVFSISNPWTSWTNKNGTLSGGLNLGGLKVSQKVSSFAVNGSNLFVGTFDAGVYMTTDGGATWTAKNSGLDAGTQPHNNLFIYSMLSYSGNLYVGTQHGGVYYSSNNGTSWSAYNTGLTTIFHNNTVQALAQVGGTLYAVMRGDQTNTVGSGLYYYTGTTWVAIGNSGIGSNISLINTLTTNGTQLLVGTENGIYSYNPSGTWTSLNNSPFSSYAVKSITKYTSGGNTYIVAGTNSSGIFYSTNGGTNWTQNSSIVYPIKSLIEYSGIVYAGTEGGGVFTSSNNCSSWASLNNGLTSTNLVINTFISYGTSIYAGIPGTKRPHYNYSSGMMSTNNWSPSNGDHLVEYGYIEARVKISDHYGLFPAFWIWGTTGTQGIDYVGDNSIELFEMTPQAHVTCGPRTGDLHTKNVMTNCMKYLSDPNVVECGRPAYNPDGSAQVHYINDYTQFHTYGVEWSPNKIIYYVDNIAIRNSPNPNSSIFDPKSIILNLALYDYIEASNNGDDLDYIYNFFKNKPEYFTSETADMTVEYVNYYTLENSDCSSNVTFNNQPNLNTYNNKVKNQITIDGAGTNFTPNGSSPKVLRAADFIQITKDFTVPSGTELYLDVNQCY